jgi:hypothetical protein
MQGFLNNGASTRDCNARRSRRGTRIFNANNTLKHLKYINFYFFANSLQKQFFSVLLALWQNRLKDTT